MFSPASTETESWRDHASTWQSAHRAIYFQLSAERQLDRLHTILLCAGHVPERLALAWALRRPGVSTVLVGGRTRAHVGQALAAREFSDLGALLDLGAPE